MDEKLPVELRDSRLVWTPHLEHQAPAPAPEDSWTALVGTLEWSISAVQNESHEPPSFLLNLRDIAIEEDAEHLLLTYPTIHDAVVAAEATHELILAQLRRRLSRPRP